MDRGWRAASWYSAGFLLCSMALPEGAMDGRVHSAEGGPPRLVPEMVSFKLLVLQFVRSYIVTNGGSPSYGEIAAGMDSNRTRVRNAIRKLAVEGSLLRRKGERGLSLPSIESEAVARLRELGWTVDEHGQFAVRDVTIHPLRGERVLDYFPPAATLGGKHGEARIKGNRRATGSRTKSTGPSQG
jgi:hypothetical protein